MLGLLVLLLFACAGPQHALSVVASEAEPATKATRKPAKAPGKVPPARGEARQTKSGARPPPNAPLNLKSLEDGLKNTDAIGLFTKIEIKNQVNDLVDEFRDVHEGRARRPMSQLRGDYDRLVLKVLALVQDEDPRLAKAIVASRESLWGILSNPQTFAKS